MTSRVDAVNTNGEFTDNWQVNSMLQALVRCNSAWSDLAEPATLKPGTTILNAGGKAQYVYFPFEGLVSLLFNTKGTLEASKDDEIQVGMLGRHDIVGVNALLAPGVNPVRGVVHAGGPAMRCSAQAARRLLMRDTASQVLVNRYVQMVLAEQVTMIACSTTGTVGQRVARMLVRASETMGTDALPFTHLFMSQMLGVRRASVTEELRAMEGLGMIRLERARIDVKKLDELRTASGPCWDALSKHRQAFRETLLPGASVDED